MENVTLHIKGMSCEHCVKAVTGALGAIDGVSEIAVNLKEGTASFCHDPARAPLASIKQAIKDEGFEPGD